MNTSRSRTADFLKGVALIAMVQLVLVEYFAQQPILNGLAGKISLFLGGSPVAPTFLAIMGYYIARQTHGFRRTISRGVKLILLGVLLNIARNAILLFDVFTAKTSADIWHLIFGTDILILAGLSLVAMAILIKILRGHVLAYLALIIVFLLLQYIIPPVEKMAPDSVILPFFYGKYPQAQFPFIPWFAYVLAGYTFYLFKKFFVSDQFKHSRTIKIILLSLSGILLILSLPFGFDVSINHRLFYHQIIKVKGGKNVPFDIRYTIHGPILNPVYGDITDNPKVPISLWWAPMHLKTTAMEALYQMNNATDMKSFEKGVSLIDIVGLYVAYGDTDGNIAMWGAGKIPIHPAGTNPRMIMDGASGKDDITGFYPFAKNPQSVNPPDGILNTSNNAPPAVDGIIYPGYYSPG